MNACVVLALPLLVALQALETESGQVFFRCQCNNVLPDHLVKNKSLKPSLVRSIRRYPAGAHCKNEEVIIQFPLRKMCVNPKAAWVISLERAVQQRSMAKMKTKGKQLVVITNTSAITNTTVVQGNNRTMVATGNSTVMPFTNASAGTQDLRFTMDNSTVTALTKMDPGKP